MHGILDNVRVRAVYYPLKGVGAKVHNFLPQTKPQTVVKIKNILQSRGVAQITHCPTTNYKRFWRLCQAAFCWHTSGGTDNALRIRPLERLCHCARQKALF